MVAVYFVLMSGFSIFLILQEKKQQGIGLQNYVYQENNTIEEVVLQNMDQDQQVTDVAKLKRDLVNHVATIYQGATEPVELAIYTRDLQMVYSSGDSWLCYCTKQPGDETGEFASLYPNDWFGQKEVKELENYLYADPLPKKPGDLDEYSLEVEGFWLDNEVLIPDKIYVTPMYAKSFDQWGYVESSDGTRLEDLVYRSGYHNTKGLPYFKLGTADIQRYASVPTDQKQLALLKMVRDKDKLKSTRNTLNLLSYECVNPVTYRYYLVMPYQNMIYSDSGDQDNYSASWTVAAKQVNLLNYCGRTLAFLWGSSLIAFLAAAWILSAQTYKTYREREEMERRRRDTTNALAHDLKTPLSIISGYAQNLMENIRTEKREHYAKHIKDNVDRMDAIILEMLELSKLESDQYQMSIEEVSLESVCRSLIDRYSLLCAERSISIELEGDAVVKADYSLILRAIDNFFTNAIEHTPEGGEIEIRIADGRFEFYNSGSRIPEDKIMDIWKPFLKADESRSNSKGSGLGLSITSTILELFHFSYGAENRDDGVVFWFVFA
jgi:signal transduction histidine kinase